MIASQAINDAIREHGARKVYAVANAAFANRLMLADIGLSADNMADVSAVQTEAYRQLGDADKAIDFAQALSDLTKDGASKSEVINAALIEYSRLKTKGNK